jgi:anti-sigma factor RsiW
MKTLTCPATRRRLHAFHDEELSISDQIAVAGHLDWCAECADEYAALGRLRGTLRALAPGRAALSREEETSLRAVVVGRAKAEQAMSLATQMREMFEDMHFVYAGAGALVAAVACVVITIGLMQFLPLPGSNRNPVQVGADVLMPRALSEPFSATPAGSEDTAIMLAAVVTREGTVESLEVVSPLTGLADTGADEARIVEVLLGAASRARFEPARVAGLPVAVNMVWLIAHTTVRASTPSLHLPGPPVAKKRAASFSPHPQLIGV